MSRLNNTVISLGGNNDIDIVIPSLNRIIRILLKYSSRQYQLRLMNEMNNLVTWRDWIHSKNYVPYYSLGCVRDFPPSFCRVFKICANHSKAHTCSSIALFTWILYSVMYLAFINWFTQTLHIHHARLHCHHITLSSTSCKHFFIRNAHWLYFLWGLSLKLPTLRFRWYQAVDPSTNWRLQLSCFALQLR